MARYGQAMKDRVVARLLPPVSATTGNEAANPSSTLSIQFPRN